MRTIAITIDKGGVGKTTLAKHLAVAAAAGGHNAMLLDIDTQQNSTSWGKRRNQQQANPLPVVRFITENDLPEELGRAHGAGCDLVLIDTPPGRSSEAPAAVEAASLVLIPFWLESDAFDGLSKTAALARRLGKPAVAVLNFATPNSRSHEDSARTVLKALDVPMCPIVLHRYEAYRLANPPGLTMQEAEPESRAAAEIGALWNWLGAEMQLSTGALMQLSTSASMRPSTNEHVHKGAA
jgi:chromosome partitioning protein